MDGMKSLPKLDYDKALVGALVVLLLLHYTHATPRQVDGTLLVTVSVIATIPVVLSAVRSLRNKRVSIDLLASFALVASLLFGEWASAAFINLMLASARIFGRYTSNKAHAAIQSLLKLRPETVKVKRGNDMVVLPVAQVRAGDLVVIESGDRVAVDGTVESGEASVDQSSLTGESVPVAKTKGDKVYSSTLNAAGSLIVRADKIGSDTTLEKIISMVETSQHGKARIRTAVDAFASWYIIVTLVGSVILYVFTRDLAFILSVLLVASADDIAVAVPMAFTAAIGYAARRGVIIKGGSFLEGLSETKTAIVDKTGTLTKGELKIQDMVPFWDYTKKDVLKFACIAETFSEHPIAKAVLGYASEAGVSFDKPDSFKELPGKGTIATYKGKEIVSGKGTFLEERGVHISLHQTGEIKQAKDNGFSVTLIGYDKRLIGFVTSADAVRPGVKDTITKLKNMGLEQWVMLTGDNEKVAARVAGEVGITKFHANLLPQGKLDYIKKYVGRRQKVMMVGDGVNDAASLALADVGVAMGTIGSDAAIEAADIALMRDDFSEIPEMVELSRYTVAVARQDFIIWGVVNVLGLILVFGRFIGPEGASAFNFITDFFPLVNSLRLFNLHLRIGRK